MAGKVDAEMSAPAEDSVNIDKYRKLVRRYIDLHMYSGALFWADKVVSISKEDPDDVYWLAQCMYLLKQYHRAAHLIRSRGLEKTHTLCRYLAAKCLLEAKELSDALQLLTDIDLYSTSGCIDSFYSIPNDLHSALLFLRGRVYEAMDNRGLAADCYRQALQQDVHSSESFQSLVQHHMLSSEEEEELLDSLPISSQCSPMEDLLLRALYGSQLKKYHSPCVELPSPPNTVALLRDNLDLKVSHAERHYYNCDYQLCLQLTDEVLQKDPYHSACLPIHIANLVELKKSNKLFYLAHRLVDLYPEMAVSWFAVGCYYYVIGKSDPARRYLCKATTLDKLFGPAWLAYGHSFAADSEHDQAMAAYFKASQLMRGCHLPLLYIGLECGLTNNVKLADKFFLQAQTIAPQDPFVVHEMGVIAFQNQEYLVAERHFTDALSRVQAVGDPVMADKWEPLLNNLGHTCRKLRKYEQALAFHRKALVLSPLNPSTFSAMGYVHALMGNTSDAVDAFHKALGIRRDDTFSTTMLSYVIEQLMEEQPPFPDAPDEPPTLPLPSTGILGDSSRALSSSSLSCEVEMLDSSSLD